MFALRPVLVAALGLAAVPALAGSYEFLAAPEVTLNRVYRLDKVTGEVGATWDERDITGSGSDLAAYGEMIPVTLIDGVQHDFWRVSEARLRAALTTPAG